MISRIKLTDFKSFHRAAFDLGPLTLLVGANAAEHYPRIRKLCPEDVGRLEERVREAFID